MDQTTALILLLMIALGICMVALLWCCRSGREQEAEIKRLKTEHTAMLRFVIDVERYGTPYPPVVASWDAIPDHLKEPPTGGEEE